MKTITNIRQIGSNKYSLIIEGKKHIVYDDVLLEYNILKKGEISDEVYNGIVSSNNYHEAYNKMLKYITAKLRTEKEIRERLTKLLIRKNDQDRIVQRLRNEKYLDDEMYVKSFINDNVLLSLNGPRKIAFELRRLGFNDNLISKYINDVPDDIWNEKAEKIINKKLKANHNLSKKMFIIKLKKDYNTLGYDEKYYNHLLMDIEFDDNEQMKKDYQKVYNKLSRKHSDEKLRIMIKQKMFQLGYNIEQIESLANKE
ncbi:MAG: RecX family transcriptional regulator [Bacilli bacterium]|nr:RecX family transcriptional regulator [Bacilli bacterium]